MEKKKVLLAENDDSLRALLSEILEIAGFEPVMTSSRANTLEVLETHARLDCCFIDLGFPDPDLPMYVDDLNAVLDKRGFPLVLTSSSGKDLEAFAQKCNAAAFLYKPYDLDELVRIARRLSR
jgi:DNA-binding NtrC family response regulator